MSDNSPFPDRTVTANFEAPPGVNEATQLSGRTGHPGDRKSFPNLPPEAGDTFGNYELLSEIARGGMGVVYRAKQKGLERVVALKMILGHADDALRQRLLLEARSAAALDHPNVVPIYDSGEVNGQLFFTMAFIDGPDLKKYAEGRGSLPLPEAMRLFGQVVAGVAHAHSKGIIHRDLKPANVMINRDGRPQVTDFGLAKRQDTDQNMTATGQVMGTPAYMAPEQARGKKTVGPPADVYALGGIMYYLLTGRPPFVGETITDILVMLATEPPTPPRTIIADLPPELEAVCLKCLEKEPENRYPDAQALLAALAPLLDRYLPSTLAEFGSGAGVSFDGTSGTGKPYGLQSTAFNAPKPGGRAGNPWLVGGGVAAAVVAAVAVAAVALSGGKGTTTAAANGGTAATVGASGTVDPIPKADPVPKADPIPKVVSSLPKADPILPANTQYASTSFPARMGRQDFALTFELIGAGYAENGTGQYKDGDRLRFRVRAGRDCHLRVWSVDADGVVVQLFPSQHDPDDRLTEGVQRDMPGQRNYKMTARPSAKGQPERLRVLASTQPITQTRPDQQFEGYNVYASVGRDQLYNDLKNLKRSIELAATNTQNELQVADAELFYLVTK